MLSKKEECPMKIDEKNVIVPLDVPKAARESFIKNYLTITRESGRLMLFAGDQKVEHLNAAFYGKGIHPDESDILAILSPRNSKKNEF
jgi:fructose-bisphosphate aldolase / 6-deoxy-5-ketofructose 1-phosphate synthase